jgi:hypothetical protein
MSTFSFESSSMQITYTLDKTDFLNHQLYLATKSPRIKRNRIKSHIWVIVMFLALASLFYVRNDIGLFYWFLLLALVAGFLFPYYSRWMHINHYKKYIDEHYSNKVGKLAVLQLEDDRIDSKDELSEGSLKLAGLTEIVEVPSAIYLRIDTSSLILPKAQIINLDEVKSALETIATNYNIPFRREMDWTWK